MRLSTEKDLDGEGEGQGNVQLSWCQGPVGESGGSNPWPCGQMSMCVRWAEPCTWSLSASLVRPGRRVPAG